MHEPDRKSHIEIVPTSKDLAVVACEIITAAAALSIGQRHFFRVALAGGSTPKPVYARLAEDPDVDWERWQVFWSDERCVPPTAPESNYRMVKETLLDRLPAPPKLVVRMAGDSDPAAAAAACERAIYEMVPPDPKNSTGALPRFDLIILGMGSDGHTASLFPHTAALTETQRLVVANLAPQLGATRLTFTYPLINAARRVLVLVSGADKAATLREVISGPFDPQRLPSQNVQPISGTVTWLVDADAFAGIDAEMR